MKIVLRTNEDDWREMYFVYPSGTKKYIHTGHDIPEFVWIDLLGDVGVEVEVVFDDFE